MVIYRKLLPRTKKRGVFYRSLKISLLNRLASYDEYPPELPVALDVNRHTAQGSVLVLIKFSGNNPKAKDSLISQQAGKKVKSSVLTKWRDTTQTHAHTTVSTNTR